MDDTLMLMSIEIYKKYIKTIEILSKIGNVMEIKSLKSLWIIKNPKKRYHRYIKCLTSIKT